MQKKVVIHKSSLVNKGVPFALYSWHQAVSLEMVVITGLRDMSLKSPLLLV
jgi:hypothetical protein